MLDKLLANYNRYEKRLTPLTRDSVIRYGYSIVQTQDLIDNNRSRLERQTEKSPVIIGLIEKLEQNGGIKVMLHTITLEHDHNILVFTDLDNEEIIYVLNL